MLTIQTSKTLEENTKPRRKYQRNEEGEKAPSKSRVKLDQLMEKATALQERLEGMEIPLHINLATKNAYTGKNSYILECEKEDKGYTSNFWIGFHQIQEMGGHIKKGSEGCPIIVYREYTPKDQESKPAAEQESRKFFRYINVFNMDCVELPEQSEEVAEGDAA